jgi:hypothetical protein
MIGRPETHPVKKIIGFSEEMIAVVESRRPKQKPVPNLSEAIRRLVELGEGKVMVSQVFALRWIANRRWRLKRRT